VRAKIRLPAAGLCGLLAIPAALGAQEADPHEVQPERPTVATHAGTVAPGWVELEMGVEADRFAGGGRQLETPTNLKIGLAKRVQLNLSGTWLRLSGGGAAVESGVGDVTVGMKWRLLDGAPVLGDFAVLPSVKLPAGSASRGTGTGTTDAGLLLISSHQLGPVAMDLNAGFTRRGGDGTVAPKSSTVWAASFGSQLVGPLGMVAEVFGYPGTSGPAGSGPAEGLIVGPTFKPRPWLAIDAGVMRRLDGEGPNAVYAGLVYNVGRLPVRGSAPPLARTASASGRLRAAP
jgi:hypothetical protein